jgi:cytoskeletal protein CcmA (bactofilin family)
VRKQLIVHSSGKVSGKIRYAKIKMEEGAEIAGDLAVLDKATAAISVSQKRVANA